MIIQHLDTRGKEMEKEIQMMEKDERCEWVVPLVTDWDIESETASGGKSINSDGIGTYS
jgi:hypothetical protein